MKLFNIFAFISIILLLIATLFYRAKWIKTKADMKNIDKFTVNIHRDSDILEVGLNDTKLYSAISLIDSIHALIIRQSGGINPEDGSSMNFDSYLYADVVLTRHGYQSQLIKRLQEVRKTRTKKEEIKYLDYLILKAWGKEAEFNSVALVSSRLMMTKIALLSMKEEI
jgi:hypothetical protein